MSRIGGLIIGISGHALTDKERVSLQSPLVVGVILFTRNYQNKEQLKSLTTEIRQINPQLLISVDHEGGRVQRFRDGFTRLPAMNELESAYQHAPREALKKAHSYGETIASELKSVGVDFSYAPVCDLNYGHNEVIGDRSFHCDPISATLLVQSFYQGLRAQNSIGVAKHFPGHGFVAIDTHLGLAHDDREWNDIVKNDLLPFKTLIDEGIEAIMPAHIIYQSFDPDNTVVSSSKWLNYLREDLEFDGLIISDDLDMKGAEHLGTIAEKAQKCFDAGVDILLCCNDFSAIDELLEFYNDHTISAEVKQRLDCLHAKLASN